MALSGELEEAFYEALMTALTEQGITPPGPRGYTQDSDDERYGKYYGVHMFFGTA